MTLPQTILAKASAIRLLGLDVDGVMTDGTVFFGGAGLETKGFNIKDGLGIRALLQYGIEVAILTGRTSDAVTRRAEDLGIRHVYQGVTNKRLALNQLVARLGIRLAEVAFMGDDLPDLGGFQVAGLAIAVADAHEAVAARADIITYAAGGRGAVREVADLLLKSQGKYTNLISTYLES